MAGIIWSNKTEFILKSNWISMVKKLIWLHQICGWPCMQEAVKLIHIYLYLLNCLKILLGTM